MTAETAHIIDNLRALVDKVMKSSNLPADDPGLLHLKRIVQHRIAALSAAAPDAQKPSAAPPGRTPRL